MCQSAISQDWAKRNPERFAANNKAYFSKEARKKSRRAYVLRTAYGMDEVDYDVLELVQDGTCLICRIKPDKPLVVDHNHDNGKVRGLLCGGCNIGIGALGDDPARLMRAAIYIAQQQNGVL
jgi:hypothetical protein